MATKKYRVTTDKGSFIVEVEDNSTPAATPHASGGTVYDDPAMAQQDKLASGEIPSTFAGGFLKSLKDQVMTPQLGKALESPAHPQSVADFLGLLVPQGVNRGAQLGQEMEEAGQASSKAAGPGILNRVRGYWKGVGQDIMGQPTATAREEMGLNRGATANPAAPPPPPVGRDFYETFKQGERSKVAEGARIFKPGQAPPSTAAPTLEDGLMGALRDGSRPESVSLPPEATITDGGATRQTGTFPKKQQVGQAGGYTSGRPAISPQRYDEITGQAASAPPPSEWTPPAPSNPPAPVPPVSRPPISVKGQTIKPGDPLYDKLMELSREDTIPHPTGDPSMVAPGEEATYNATVAQPAPAPRSSGDIVAEKIGQAQPMPDELRSTVGDGPSPQQVWGNDPIAEELSRTSQPLGQPRPIKINPQSVPPQLWPELRRYYGSEKLAQLTGLSPEEIQRMAPGPSLQPLEVQDSINQNPDGLFKFLPK